MNGIVNLSLMYDKVFQVFKLLRMLIASLGCSILREPQEKKPLILTVLKASAGSIAKKFRYWVFPVVETSLSFVCLALHTSLDPRLCNFFRGCQFFPFLSLQGFFHPELRFLFGNGRKVFDHSVRCIHHTGSGESSSQPPKHSSDRSYHRDF